MKKKEYNPLVKNNLNLSVLNDYEISNIGKDVQSELSNSVSNLLEKCKMSDLGKEGESIDKFTESYDKMKVLLENPITNPILSAIRRVTNYNKKVNDKMDDAVAFMESSKEALEEKTIDLEDLKDSMISIYSKLEPYIISLENCLIDAESNVPKEKDSIEYVEYLGKINAIAKRKEDLATTKTTARQTAMQTVLLIQGNRALISQIDYAIDNVIPLWKVQMLNHLNIEMQKKQLEIQKTFRKMVNDVTIRNSEDIKNNIDNIIINGSTPIISIETLEKVDQMIVETITNIKKAQNESYNTHLKTIKKIEELDNKNVTENKNN